MNKARILGIPNRYLVLLLIVIGIVLHYVIGIAVIAPHVQLPAEKFSSDGFLTNTLVATLIADVLILLIALGVYRAAGSGSLVPKGFSGAVEAFVEVLYNLTESTAGKFTRLIFPWFAAITMFVLVVNWMELIPGVDSIGLFQPSHVHYEDEAAGHAGDDHAAFDEYCTQTTVLGMVSVGGAGGDHDGECSAAVVPFVRVASTDLNFTAALAVVSVVMTQVIGVRALGMGYFQKFWYTKTLFDKPVFGVIDFAVGLLEIVAEIAKVLSFSFRLFGNIFAGSVLLFVIGSLVPVFAQSLFLMLEFFVGAIQAIVFGMLTMVFMSQATQSHHEEGEEHH
ncbi:MAG TPA: F0F1 ATP synthase subunit A [Anaerolineales bacterium]|nr:F0F1 ATP synthase subunit A [Anaerolineales bacterium]